MRHVSNAISNHLRFCQSQKTANETWFCPLWETFKLQRAPITNDMNFICSDSLVVQLSRTRKNLLHCLILTLLRICQEHYFHSPAVLRSWSLFVAICQRSRHPAAFTHRQPIPFFNSSKTDGAFMQCTSLNWVYKLHPTLLLILASWKNIGMSKPCQGQDGEGMQIICDLWHKEEGRCQSTE